MPVSGRAPVGTGDAAYHGRSGLGKPADTGVDRIFVCPLAVRRSYASRMAVKKSVKKGAARKATPKKAATRKTATKKPAARKAAAKKTAPKKKAAAKKVVSYYEDFIHKNIGSFHETLDVSKVVEGEMNQFSVQEVEDLIFVIIRKELNAITWIGGFLGTLIGIVFLFI